MKTKHDKAFMITDGPKELKYLHMPRTGIDGKTKTGDKDKSQGSKRHTGLVGN